ncbi:MAG: PspC domain-containing protein [Kineosporiaceae bacterium]
MSTNPPPEPPAGPTSGPAPGTPPGTPPGGQQPPGGQPVAEFFDRIRSIGIVRPDEGRWAAGVCAGIARRTGIDVVLVRGLFVVLAVLGGGALFLYGLAWLFLPHPDGRIHAQEVLRGVVTAGFVGSVIAVLSGVPFGIGFRADAMGWGWGFHPGGLWLLLGVGLVVWIVSARKGKQPPGSPGGSDPGGSPSWGTPGNPPRAAGSDGPGGTPRATSATTGWAPTPVTTTPVAPAPDLTRPSHGLTRATLGAAVVAGSAVVAYDSYVGSVPSTAAVVTATALGVVALGVLLAGVSGRRSGGLAPIAWILAVVAVNAAAISNVGTARPDVTWRPTSAAVAEAGYDTGAGEVRVDLTDPSMRTGATAADPVELSAGLGVGRMVVVVPAGTATKVDVSVGLGQVDDRAGGTGTAGGSRNFTLTAGTGAVTVVVHARVGLGELVIVPEGSDVAAGTTPAHLAAAVPARPLTEALR